MEQIDTNESKQKRCRLMASLYKPLKAADVKKIVDCSFEILERSGMAVYSETAWKAFEAAGAQMDPHTRVVKLPKALVEDVVASNPSSVTLYSRDGNFDAILEKNRVHYGTGGTAIYVLDPDSQERRPSLLKDVALNAKIANQLENIHVFTINVFPNDIENSDDIDVNRFFHSLDNTTKHIMGGIYSLAGCRQVVQMARMLAPSPDALREKPFVSFITLIISPFKIDKDYGEITCYLARESLPVVVPSEPICGTTAPVTLAGNVLTHITETLGGIALIQSVRKGAPGICGSVGSVPDLRTMNHLGGPIERAMLNAAVAQVAQYLEIPLYSTGGTSDAKAVDVQAAYESAMSSLLVSMSGANYIHDAAGLMEADLTVSYEKLILDNEILGMCRRVLQGIEVNDETLAAELMIEKGPGKDYLTEQHTLRHMRSEFFIPRLANRDKHQTMSQDDDALTRARFIVEHLRKTPSPSCLPVKIRNKILKKFPQIRSTSLESSGG
jgi:trimethylamine--corrinoid protein Co-methyltransferase